VKILKEEQSWKQILENLKIGFLTLDSKGKDWTMQYGNQEAQRMLNLDKNKINLKDLLSSIHTQDRPKSKIPSRMVLKMRKTDTIQIAPPSLYDVIRKYIHQKDPCSLASGYFQLKRSS